MANYDQPMDARCGSSYQQEIVAGKSRHEVFTLELELFPLLLCVVVLLADP